MSFGFDVVIEDLRRAARSAEDVAEAAAHVNAPGALDPVVPALPGSHAAAAAAALGVAWGQQISAWRRDMSGYAANLVAAADSYQAGDDDGAQELRAAAADPWWLGWADRR